MSTKTVTTNQQNQTQANTYNPASMNLFNQLQPLIGSNLSNDMQLDPTKSATYNFGLQNMLANARGLGQRNSSNFAANLGASGFGQGNLPAFQQAMLGNIGRQNTGLSANAFIQNYMNYDMLRRQATQLASGIKPLQTGGTMNSSGTQTQTQSGLGTWLPQVAGMGLGLATGGMSGGFGGLLGMGSKVLSPKSGPGLSGDYFGSGWGMNPAGIGSNNALSGIMGMPSATPRYGGNPFSNGGTGGGMSYNPFSQFSMGGR